MAIRRPVRDRRISGGSGPKAFTPWGGISGAVMAFRSDLGTSSTTNGTALTSWADQTGNGNNATTGTGGPTYQTGGVNGLPYVNFAATQFLVHGLTLAGSPCTVWFVGYVATAGSYHGVLSLGTGGLWVYGQLGTASWGAYEANGDEPYGAALSALNKCTVLSSAANNITLRLGTASVNKTGGTAFYSGGNTCLGAGANGPESLQGPLYELVVWNKVLSAAEYGQLDAYALTRYGV